MTTILIKADPARAALWKSFFADAAPDIDCRAWPDAGNGADIDWLLTWDVPEDLLIQFPNLKVLHSLGAGVDHVDISRLPPSIQLVRMVEPGIQAAMNEWVTMAVLAAHRRIPAYLAQQRQQKWSEIVVPPASERCVGIMGGAGVLGQSVLGALKPFRFQTRTWGRTSRAADADKAFAGDGELEPFLAGADILVCLIPLTPTSRGILNSRVFSALPSGATVINVSRGGNLVQRDLLEALDGHLEAAILDVCDPQPLPKNDPLWSHPKVMITPHIATRTQPRSGAAAVIANIRRWENGQPLQNTVDRALGY